MGRVDVAFRVCVACARTERGEARHCGPSSGLLLPPVLELGAKLMNKYVSELGFTFPSGSSKMALKATIWYV